uniref:Uncharacterized protein n=1 Tax=Mus musculus TaxID=10090 RepID=Q3V2G8_MOUSE|nr:unnamed protein product [Mus musculus]
MAVLHSHEQGLRISGPGTMPHPPAHHVPLLSTRLLQPEQDRLHLQFPQHCYRCGCGATVCLPWSRGSATSVGPRDTTHCICSSRPFWTGTWSLSRSCLIEPAL